MDELTEMEARALLLFDLLDDIDTADDMAKDNHVAYRQMVRKLVNRRWEVATVTGDNGEKVEWKPVWPDARERRTGPGLPPPDRGNMRKV